MTIVAIGIVLISIFLSKPNAEHDIVNTNSNNTVEKQETTQTEQKEEKEVNENRESETIMESEATMDSTIKTIINNKKYDVTLEQNETTKQFVNMLPKEFNMSELNENEKYVYLDTKLPTNSYSPKQIEMGDIMLFGNNCLVVFYKSFNTPYSYTKIGHIENFEDLGNKDITIRFEK